MSIKATAFEQIKKLLGWCPMKDYLKKDGQEGCFPEFKLENRNIQLVPSSLGLHESGILKVRASLFDGGWVLWILIITFFTIIVSLFFWTCIPEGSYLVIFSGLIMFLMPLMLFLNHPNTASVIPGNCALPGR